MAVLQPSLDGHLANILCHCRRVQQTGRRPRTLTSSPQVAGGPLRINVLVDLDMEVVEYQTARCGGVAGRARSSVLAQGNVLRNGDWDTKGGVSLQRRLRLCHSLYLGMF